MKPDFFVFIAVVVFFTSCQKDSDSSTGSSPTPSELTYELPVNSTIEEDRAEVDSLFAHAEQLKSGIACEAANSFDYVGYGSKPCGGPWGYVSYPKSIELQFIAAINLHKAAEHAFNVKWEAISDCALARSPTGIRCEDNEAVLVFE